MKAQCILCDQIDVIDEESLLAKKLKYNQIRSYLCNECYQRIKVKTLKRYESGNFHLYESRTPH